jgi:fatty acid-binding protein DegV
MFGLKLIITLDKSGLLFRNKASKPDETIKRAQDALADLIPLNHSQINRFIVFTNSHANKKFNIDQYLEILKTFYPNIKIEYAELPSVITAHVGPNFFAFGMDLE